MSAHEDRRAELIAAAVSDDLSAAEYAELRTMAAADSAVDAEIDDFRRITGRLAAGAADLSWDETAPSEGLRDRVVGIRGEGARRPVVLAAAAAVVGIAVGAGVVLGIGAATDNPVTGPPGTLGAFEEIDFTGVPSGIDIDGGLVAHTWGTETVLEMDGVPDQEPYEVYVLAQSGASVDPIASGTFLGSTVPIDCRMNAAVLRENVTGIEIRHVDGSILARAQVADTN